MRVLAGGIVGLSNVSAVLSCHCLVLLYVLFVNVPLLDVLRLCNVLCVHVVKRFYFRLLVTTEVTICLTLIEWSSKN